ncbi:MAG: DNA polymerase III subunit beta [Anaerolineaceae bacterium]|nr:DNA polymerase III subunit beta [Anaerolineaceae bacterium]
MRASISQQQLSHGLNIVSRAVSPRSSLPVLANILVATDEGRVRLSATNLELGITAWIGAQIEEEGSITVPSRTFCDLVSTLSNDNVKLAVNHKTQVLNVQCGGSNTDIKGIDAQEFPPMPVPDLANGIELNVTDFKEMIHQVAFSSSTDDARPVLQGVMLTVEDSAIKMAATDGFRISVRTSSISSPLKDKVSAIVPARALSELARIAVDSSQKIIMVIQPDRGQVLFHIKDIELVSQLIEGNFPDYNVIIPRGFKTSTIVNTAAFLKACKQAEIIARDSNNVVRVNILPGGERPGQLEISAQSEETGSSEIFVDATIEGPGLVIAFNVAFLREVLEVMKSPSIALETNANNTPGMIRPVGNEEFLHVIMPMHLG